MDDFSNKLNKILSNPQSMEQIMNLAKSFNLNQTPSSENQEQSGQPTKEVTAVQSAPQSTAPDLGMLKTLINSPLGQTLFSGEKERMQLLRALQPYLNSTKRQKLSQIIGAMESMNALGSIAKML